jgi:hypothetical protein
MNKQNESQKNIGRRGFLQSSAAVMVASSLGCRHMMTAGNNNRDDQLMRGFIVSDAHFGWRGSQQPEPEQQAEMMRRIIKQFPDLDVFLDTGDAHHSYATDEDRGKWVDIIQGGCGTLPFYFITGNHDVTKWNYDGDPELRSNILGSVPCRPYYSFDFKGIHFVSLPELMMSSYVTQESLDWLALDLQVNRDKTTIVLSHNSIEGTTLPHDDLGYRRVANSREVFDFLNNHRNVAAWMHGHNHTWELVKVLDKFYVSNGRIGGFDPPYEGHFGRGNLGGIYFELGPDHFTVRGYSASKECFFDSMEDYEHMSRTLHIKTSYDPTGEPCFSYGTGGARDGQRICVYHHHVPGQGQRELFMTGCEDPAINENSELTTFSQRTVLSSNAKLIPGVEAHPKVRNEKKEDTSWEWLDPGMLLKALEGVQERTVEIPSAALGSRHYYRCAPGKKYKAVLELDTPEEAVGMQLQLHIHDMERERLAVLKADKVKLRPGRGTYEAVFQVPEFPGSRNIYQDPDSENCIHIFARALFQGQKQNLMIHRFALQFEDAIGVTRDATAVIDGREFSMSGSLAPGQLKHFDILDKPAARSMIELKAGGSRKVTWLVRQKAVAWQVRNALVADRGQWLDIGPMRHRLSAVPEIVIAPMRRMHSPFVHRLRYINRAEAGVYNAGSLKVRVHELLGSTGEVEVAAGRKPREVKGADRWNFEQDRLICQINRPGDIEVIF